MGYLIGAGVILGGALGAFLGWVLVRGGNLKPTPPITKEALERMSDTHEEFIPYGGTD